MFELSLNDVLLLLGVSYILLGFSLYQNLKQGKRTDKIVKFIKKNLSPKSTSTEVPAEIPALPAQNQVLQSSALSIPAQRNLPAQTHSIMPNIPDVPPEVLAKIKSGDIKR